MIWGPLNVGSAYAGGTEWFRYESSDFTGSDSRFTLYCLNPKTLNPKPYLSGIWYKCLMRSAWEGTLGLTIG